MKNKEFIREFIDFTDKAYSIYHVVNNIEEKLLGENFVELQLGEKWNLELNKKYFIKKNSASIVAFTTPKTLESLKFKITLNHTDAPGFKVKPNSEVISEESYLRLNTEVYGGPILNTWLDRPLSLAGRVFVKGETPLKPIEKLVNIDKTLMVIPNLAIHQNREINEGIKLSRQNDMLPVISLISDKLERDNFLVKLLGKTLGVEFSEILSFELYLYDRNKGEILGNSDELILTSKIDNLASTFSGLEGLIEAKNESGINVLACFDNEEIGSQTTHGGDSNFLPSILERIALAFNSDRSFLYQSLNDSFMISVDGAHATHPAKGSKMDITNRPKLNKGVVIKHSAAHSYTSDGYSTAVIKSLASSNNISIQEFANHSDERGGSTLGPLVAKYIGVSGVDLGIPMLSMHSIKETAGNEDIYSLKELLKAFYSLNN